MEGLASLCVFGAFCERGVGRQMAEGATALARCDGPPVIPAWEGMLKPASQ